MALETMSKIVGHVFDSLNHGPRMTGSPPAEMFLTTTLWSCVSKKCLRVNGQREREDPEEKFHASDLSLHHLDCADAWSARRTLFYPGYEDLPLTVSFCRML
jgi:hypothetical protein